MSTAWAKFPSAPIATNANNAQSRKLDVGPSKSLKASKSNGSVSRTCEQEYRQIGNQAHDEECRKMTSQGRRRAENDGAYAKVACREVSRGVRSLCHGSVATTGLHPSHERELIYWL